MANNHAHNNLQQHAHAHHHHDSAAHAAPKLVLALGLTLAFVAVEALAGWRGQSLALLSDAAHNLSDALALGFSWFAIWMAKRPPTSEKTFGYHRVGILAALVNAVSLILMALFILWEAWHRFRAPDQPHGALMIIVALVAVAINLTISRWLHSGKHDLNIRSAYLHMIGDALSAAGVVIAGLFVAITGVAIADPIASVLIGILILWSSWGVLSETLNVLLEGVPYGIDIEDVRDAIHEIPGARDVHDLHVWTVASGRLACSCHVVVNDQSMTQSQEILRAVVAVLHNFGVNHTTVQLEVEGCDPAKANCCLG